MIVISEKVSLTSPVEFKNLPTNIRNIIFAKLDQGMILFVIPTQVVELSAEKDNQEIQIWYKVGFLMDLFAEVYPNYSKGIIYELVSTQYHLFLSERRLSSLYKNYLNEFRKGK